VFVAGFNRAAGGGVRAGLYAIPIPHIFSGYSNASLLGKGEEGFIKVFVVILWRKIVGRVYYKYRAFQYLAKLKRTQVLFYYAVKIFLAGNFPKNRMCLPYFNLF